MKKAAKLIIIDENDKFLLLFRSAHPHFGDDPDLPGGTLENGEKLIDTMVREVSEEIGVSVKKSAVRKLYAGDEYSKNDTHCALFATKMMRPKIRLSWEHKSYDWLPRAKFLAQAKNANDTYMHMAHDVVAKTASPGVQ